MEHTIFLEKVNVYSYIWTIFYSDRHLLINRQPLYHGKTVILQQNDLSISNNVRHNIKRILNENRTLKQQDFADAIDMDKSQFHRMLNMSTAIDVDYVVKWMKWLGIDWIELIEKPIIQKNNL